MHIEFLMNLVIFTLALILYAGVMRQRRPLLSIFSNAAFGVAILGISAIFGHNIGININFNAFTLGFSAIFGIPGAIFSILLAALQKL